MAKLHLKETPEERAERRWRKAQKMERKKLHRRSHHAQNEKSDADEDEVPPQKRPRVDDDDVVADEEGWLPPESSVKIDADQIRAEVEERMFREKLFDAMHDDFDNRLDDLEAQFNDYAHVPYRWRTTAGAQDPDPHAMNDDEYAEWIREGMWRRTHKAEMEERQRKKAERKARRERERKAREETARLERQREAERELKREVKERRRLRDAWGFYESRWKTYASGEKGEKHTALKFEDIPWPVFSVPRTVGDLTSERISAFLFFGLEEPDALAQQRARKERIREALLRWHPDKFEGKMSSRLDSREREAVMEGVGVIARCLNAMMAAG